MVKAAILSPNSMMSAAKLVHFLQPLSYGPFLMQVLLEAEQRLA